MTILKFKTGRTSSLQRHIDGSALLSEALAGNERCQEVHQELMLTFSLLEPRVCFFFSMMLESSVFNAGSTIEDSLVRDPRRCCNWQHMSVRRSRNSPDGSCSLCVLSNQMCDVFTDCVLGEINLPNPPDPNEPCGQIKLCLCRSLTKNHCD